MTSDEEWRWAVMFRLNTGPILFHVYKKKSRAQKSLKRLKNRYGPNRFIIQKIKWRQVDEENQVEDK